MLVTYCDLCGNPIKGKKFILAVAEFNITEEDIEKAKGDYQAALRLAELYQKQLEEVERAEVCPECKKLFDRLFRRKKKAYQLISEEIERLYESIKRKKKKNDKPNQSDILRP